MEGIGREETVKQKSEGATLDGGAERRLYLIAAHSVIRTITKCSFLAGVDTSPCVDGSDSACGLSPRGHNERKRTGEDGMPM
jgi:hypothetical protein